MMMNLIKISEKKKNCRKIIYRFPYSQIDRFFSIEIKERNKLFKVGIEMSQKLSYLVKQLVVWPTTKVADQSLANNVRNQPTD